MRCETTSPGVQECALCASSAHDVHHASVCVNVVIGVLVVLCELHVIVRVHVISLCDDAVVGLTLGLIAHVVVVVFVVAILHKIFCIWRKTLYTEVRELEGSSVPLAWAMDSKAFMASLCRLRRQPTSEEHQCVQDRLVQEPCLNSLVALPQGRHLSLRRETEITQTSSMESPKRS